MVGDHSAARRKWVRAVRKDSGAWREHPVGDALHRYGCAALATSGDRDLGDLLHHYDRDQLRFQIAEITGKSAYLRPGVGVGAGDVVLDVGANVGVAAAFFAVRGAGEVHSFEPIEPLFRLLEQNVSRFPACVAHGYGLGAAPATTEITFYPRAAAMSSVYADPVRDGEFVQAYLANNGIEGAAAEESVRAFEEATVLSCELRTVSQVIEEHGLERVDLLKVDVERAERDVLAGIEERDWSRIRQLVVEVHDLDGRLRAILERVRGLGYSVEVDQDPDWAGTEVHMLYARRP